MNDQHRVPTRRAFLQLAGGAFAVAALPIAVRARKRLVRHTVPAMGALAELAALHRNERYAAAALQAAAAELLRIERLMTRFDVRSDIGRANAAAGASRVAISAETAFVLERAIAWADATTGAFDPALARVVDLWDVKHRHTPPPARALKRLAGRQLYRRIDLSNDRVQPSVFVREPDAAIDLGGIAAGYGVDRAVQVLREWGITDGYVNVGGDIYALGESPAGQPWEVGVRSPSDPAALIGKVALTDGAIATSGDYEQGYTLNGRRYHHIIDPATAEPRLTPMHSLTVTASCCLIADAASTAVYGWSAAEANRLLNVMAPGAQITTA